MSSSAITRPSAVVRLVLPALLALTGATGLLYEVVLGRYLTLHLGSSGASQAVTLGAFLGGLSLGAVIAGKLCATRLHGVARPLLAYCALETGIGLWAALFPTVSPLFFSGFHAVSVGFSPGSTASIAAQMALAALLVLPMSTLMGATLPVLAAAVSRSVRTDAVPLIGRYYAVNAFGGATGALLAGFWLIENLGLDAPLRIGAAVNVAVAIAVALLVRGRRELAGDPLADDGIEPDASAPPYAAFLFAAAGTGMVTLVYEVVWVRLTGLLLGASVYAFALMLTVVIVGIASGSAIATWLVGRGKDPRRVFAATQIAAALLAFGLYLRLPSLPLELLDMRLGIPATYANYTRWLLSGGGWVAAHFLPAAMALGAAFPALLDGARLSGGGVARATAWILGSNTIGNLAGALLGGFVLMPIFGVENVLILGACGSSGLALLCLPRPVGVRAKAIAGGIAAVVVAVGLFASPDVTLLHRGLFRLRDSRVRPVAMALDYIKAGKEIFREDGKDASISVDFRERDGLLLFRTNGKTDGSNFEPVTQVGLGHLGFVARPDATDVFVVGLGTGQSAASAASHPQARVQVAELSPAVVEVAKLFGPFNADVMNNPRVRVDVADAREALRKAPPGAFDVIVSEPSNPWVVGVADLYTVEAFSLMASRLKDDGALVQWIQVYEMSDDTFRQILCTLQSVFGHAAIFRLEAADVAVVASRKPLAIDVERVRERYESKPVQAALAAAQHARLPRTVDELLALQMADAEAVRAVCKGFSTHMRDRRPSIEYTAPRDFFAGVAPTRIIRALDTRLAGTPRTALARDLQAHRARDPKAAAARVAAIHKYIVKSPGTHEAPLQMAGRDPAEKARRSAAVAAGLPDAATATDDMARRVCPALARRAPWAVDTLQTMLGPVTTNARIRAWHRRCRGETESPPRPSKPAVGP